MNYRRNPVKRMDLVGKVAERIRKIGDLTYPEQRKIYKAIAERAEGSVLIAGAGLGVGAPYFHEPTVTDLVEEHCVFIRAVYPLARVNVWDITAIPYRKHNEVVAVEVIEHCEDPEQAFANLKASAESRVWISTPNRNSRLIGDAGPRNAFHVAEYTPDEMRKILGGFNLYDEDFNPVPMNTTKTPLVYECSL